MKFVDAVQEGLKLSFQTSGRSSRSEYWWFYLFMCLAQIPTLVLDVIFFPEITEEVSSGPITIILILLLLPSWISVSVRRLHDINRTGKWMWLSLTVIGWLFPIVYWHIKKGTSGDNRYGPDPLSFYNS